MICETPPSFQVKSSENHIRGCITPENVILNSVCRSQSTTSTALKSLDKLYEFGLRTKTREKRYLPIDSRKHVIFEAQPPRSPDLTPLDFYLWGQIKTLMYSDPTENGFFTNAFLLPVQQLQHPWDY